IFRWSAILTEMERRISPYGGPRMEPGSSARVAEERRIQCSGDCMVTFQRPLILRAAERVILLCGDLQQARGMWFRAMAQHPTAGSGAFQATFLWQAISMAMAKPIWASGVGRAKPIS